MCSRTSSTTAFDIDEDRVSKLRDGRDRTREIDEARVAEVHEKRHYDFFYLECFSPWLGVMIFFQIIKTILTGFGSS